MLSRNRGRRTDSRPTAVVVAAVVTDAAAMAAASGTWRQRRKMTDRNGSPQREEGSRLWVGKVGSGLGFGSEAAVGSRFGCGWSRRAHGPALYDCANVGAAAKCTKHTIKLL